MGSKGFRSTCSGEVPAGAIRRTAAMGQVTVGAAVIGCKRLIMGRVSPGSGLRSEMRGSGEDAGSRALGGLRSGAGDDRDSSHSEGTT